MRLHIPPALAHHEDHLRGFFEAMVHKLYVNAHKDDLVEKDVPKLLDLMAGEVEEFKEQLLADEADPNAMFELADMGNFSYLLYRFLRSKGYADPKERFLKAYMAPLDNGQLVCTKTRSGSRYQVGEVIQGTVRNGQVFIRTQQSETGASVSLSRASIVWWFTKGVWPTGKLRHRDGNTMNDAFDNLEEVESNSKAEYPFVVQWKPRGRENDGNWGKYVYQRRHNGVLVKSSTYYDTPSDAATNGLLEWKEKTRAN